MEQGGSPIKTVLGSLAIAGDPLNIGGVRSQEFQDLISKRPGHRAIVCHNKKVFLFSSHEVFAISGKSPTVPERSWRLRNRPRLKMFHSGKNILDFLSRWKSSESRSWNRTIRYKTWLFNMILRLRFKSFCFSIFINGTRCGNNLEQFETNVPAVLFLYKYGGQICFSRVPASVCSLLYRCAIHSHNCNVAFWKETFYTIKRNIQLKI